MNEIPCEAHSPLAPTVLLAVFRRETAALLALTLALLLPGDAFATSRPEALRFQRSIIDQRTKLNPRFKKVAREKTEYIIVHTSEGGLSSALRVISKGKVVNGKRITPGGHAHYVIARSGTTYRTLDKRYVADHAGRSMWDGVSGISDISIGVELVGYHYGEITRQQYRSLELLLDLLQKIYGLEDRQVLTHSQVAYGKPNRWIPGDHRGRKRCAKNLDRSRAGLGTTWAFDPDVRSGRLTADAELSGIYYGRGGIVAGATGSNVVSEDNTAWRIAGEDYDAVTTRYTFPGGTTMPGNVVATRVGWHGIPKGTVVLLNAEESGGAAGDEGPVKTIGEGRTAWTLAGPDYKEQTTIYIFPDGTTKTGRQISDWDDLPADTRLIVGYRGPYKIARDRLALEIAGNRYDDRSTVYLFPDKTLRTGDRIDDFNTLPEGVGIFLSADES